MCGLNVCVHENLYQSRSFSFPKRSFAKKLERIFQASWFDQWTWNISHILLLPLSFSFRVDRTEPGWTEPNQGRVGPPHVAGQLGSVCVPRLMVVWKLRLVKLHCGRHPPNGPFQRAWLYDVSWHQRALTGAVLVHLLIVLVSNKSTR